MFIQCRSLDISLDALGAVVIACANGSWANIASDLPADAEYVQSVPMMAKGMIRIFFYHNSFPESEDIQSVPQLPAPKITVAERGAE